MATIQHGFQDTRRAIEKRLFDNYATTPIKWENVRFQETTGNYVALFVNDGEGNRIAIGDQAPLTRFVGVIQVQIFGPEDQGVQSLETIADEIANIFHEQRFSFNNSGIIRCKTSSRIRLEPRNGWQQLNVNTPFERDRQN